MSKGFNIAESAMQLLDSTFADTKPNIQQAVDRVGHIDGTKAELMTAIAYLALQVQAYKRISNLDATLAISNIESVITDYRRRHP